MGDPAAAGLRYESAAGRWVILATVLGSAMAAIDSTVVSIALPAIGRQFHASVASLQWVVTGYLLALAALLLVGGTLGDQLGRRRLFTVGVAWFAAASALCALAPDAPALIATRLLQGVGAALLVPGSLSIIQSSFSVEDRGRAIGVWSGLGGVATAAGPLVGGYLISAVSWRWIFLINVPLGAVVLWVAARHVPESRQQQALSRLDLRGVALTVVSLAGITYGLIAGPTKGWTSPSVLGPLVVGLAAGVAFVLVERDQAAPMVPLAIFRERQFTVTNLVTLLVYAALSGALFLLPVELEVVNRYSPLAAGMSLLPLTVMMLLLSARSGRLAGRIGPRLQMGVGPVVVGGGLVMLVRATQHSSYFSGVLPAVLVLGLGLAVTVAPLTATALSSVAGDHAGLASAVNNDVARIGGLIAVAALPALAGISGQAYLHPSALAHGFRTAAVIAGLWCVAGGVLAAAGISNHPVGEAAGNVPEETDFHCALEATPLVGRRP